MLDLTGWWAVADDGEKAVMCECMGIVSTGDRSWLVLRDPVTRGCDFDNHPNNYEWFAPEDRAAADARAAEINADYAGDPETEEAA